MRIETPHFWVWVTLSLTTMTFLGGTSMGADVNTANGGGYNPFNISIQPSKEQTLEFENSRSVHSSVANEEVPLVKTKCDGSSKVKFSYGGKGCTPVEMRNTMAEHVNKWLLTCVQEAGKAAGLGNIQGVDVQTSGCFNDRTTHAGKVSNHARGRACDVNSFKLQTSGETMDGKQPGSERDPNKKFYDAFRDCWQKSIMVATQWACQGKTGESGSGSIGAPGHEPPPANHDHCDHIHLSFPECADNGAKS